MAADAMTPQGVKITSVSHEKFLAFEGLIHCPPNTCYVLSSWAFVFVKLLSDEQTIFND